MAKLSKFSAEELAKSIAIALIAPPIVSVASGCGSWLIGLLYGDLILGTLAQLGIHNLTMFQLGVVCGFFGSFLRTKTYVGKEPE